MVRLAFGDKVMMVIIYIFLALLAFVTFYPFWNGLVISFNSGSDTAMGALPFGPGTLH